MSEGGAPPPRPLPPELLKFLEENHLDPSIYSSSHSVPRYIRVKPGCEGCIEELEAEINCKAVKVDWLPGFYSLPHDVQIAGTSAYQEGKIYGMDAASGAAVSALGVSPGDHVLDLCAAPGAKLCMLLDVLGNSGSVTGVDKFEHWGWETFQQRVFDAERTEDSLAFLQLKLLRNGFRLLKAGGTLVYSTCSLTVAQNEDVVDQFMSQNDSAVLQEIDAAKGWPCKSGRTLGTLRFDPATSHTSGLFVARFTKLTPR
ncbi:hypothetical protein MLD38_029576 [Melastoma candidum]|uniref:Uncharacterized protein n=1 Tax=Melastoma candidum TaxID=119954 RepID=A0ACB9N9V2_9MYRT|nr:hypothetical protein MLD38_029576 [Melastoma candidum]